MYPVQTTAPQISTYKDYRDFLRDLIAWQKHENSKYSLAYYSRRMKLSDAYLKLVVQGRRSLDLDIAFDLATAMGLSPSERAYFVVLVLENQTKSMGLKRYFRSQLRDAAKEKFAYTPDRKLVSVFEDALVWEVFSLVGVDGFGPDPHWISKKLKSPEATPAGVAKALDKLFRLGAIEKTERGDIVAKDIVVPRRFSPARAYVTALSRSLAHLEQGLVDSSYFDSLCLIVNREQLAEIRSILEDTKRKISRVVTNNKGPRTHIAHFNANLFLASD